MKVFYNIGIRLYVSGIRVVSLFNEKARLWLQGRRNIFPTIAAALKPNEDRVWFHCASLGEFEQGRPLIEAFKEKYPQYKIVLTFFSPSGYEVRKNYASADYVFYLPHDTSSNAKQLIELIEPRAVFIVKYEYWYNYFKELHQQAIPIYLVSAIFREDQLFFKSYGGFYKKILSFVTHFFLQNEESAHLLSAIGLNNYTVTGDTRLDRVTAIASTSKDIPIAKQFSNGEFTLVAGSTWPKDEALLADVISRKPNLKLIIAPHEISDAHLDQLLTLFKDKAILYSQTSIETFANHQVLIIDNIGMLSSLYKYGSIAYIGGGFGKGIHNVPEAAAYGVPVLFGPNYAKFQEAKDLIQLGGAFMLDNVDAAHSIVEKLQQDESYRKSAGVVCLSYIEKNKGATQKIMDSISL